MATRMPLPAIVAPPGLSGHTQAPPSHSGHTRLYPGHSDHTRPHTDHSGHTPATPGLPTSTNTEGQLTPCQMRRLDTTSVSLSPCEGHVCLTGCPSVRPTVCMCICTSVCLPVCLYVCLSVCLAICLPGCLLAFLFFCLTVSGCQADYLSVCMLACLSFCVFICLSARLSTRQSVYIVKRERGQKIHTHRHSVKHTVMCGTTDRQKTHVGIGA